MGLGGRAVGWLEAEFQDWLQRRIEASRNAARWARCAQERGPQHGQVLAPTERHELERVATSCLGAVGRGGAQGPTHAYFGRAGLIMMCAPGVPGNISHGAPGPGVVGRPVDSGVAPGV